MTKKIIVALLFAMLLPLAASAQVVVQPPEWEPFIGTDPIDGASLVGQGFGCYSVTTAVQLSTAPNCATPGVAIHRLARHAIISVESGSIRVRYDGTNPTATAGEIVSAGEKIRLENQRSMLLAFRMISTSGTATVTVTYAR